MWIHTGPAVFEPFRDGTWVVQPLRARREDLLALARGFVTQALAARSVAPVRGPAASEPLSGDELRRVAFSGVACTWIERTFWDASMYYLYSHMKILASQLDISRNGDDLIHYPDGRRRITEEALLQHLPEPVHREPEGFRSSESSKWLHHETILNASKEAVRMLAVRYGGNLSKLAKDHQISRPTLVKRWQDNNVLDEWRQAGGRRRMTEAEIRRHSPSDALGRS